MILACEIQKYKIDLYIFDWLEPDWKGFAEQALLFWNIIYIYIFIDFILSIIYLGYMGTKYDDWGKSTDMDKLNRIWMRYCKNIIMKIL